MIKKVDYVILGGGLAGLSAARHLIDLGIYPLVIEAGSYPSHKVCGEFISPSGVGILRKWGISPLPIHQIEIHTLSQQFNFQFSIPAGSLSHLTLDLKLAKQIEQAGACLLTQTKVEKLTPGFNQEDHLLTLSSGEEISAKHLLIASGRIPGLNQPKIKMRYKGFKAHFTNVSLSSTLQMFAFPGAYLGVVPVENGNVNLACLAKTSTVQQASSEEFMQKLIDSHSVLHDLLKPGFNIFEEWMEASVPSFGIRHPPNWPRTYWIGDSVSTIPPASGNGLSLALASGYLAAEFAKNDDSIGFKKAWKKRVYSQILMGKTLHSLFINPFLSESSLSVARYFPHLAQKIFNFTRDPGF